ncbi:MAG: response regulator [Acidobacteriota bacterium]|nr:response regulator [Acidobacteriota bacterium]
MSPLDERARAEVRRTFALESPARIRRLADALEELAAGTTSAAEAARFEAHALRGAASVAGRDELARICASIETLLARDGSPASADLLAAAQRVRAAGRPVEPLGRRRSLADRVLPHRFMSQLAVILVLTTLPAFGISAYDAYHGRRVARARIVEQAMAEAQLAAQAERQLIDGGVRLLQALAQTREIRTGTRRACSTLLGRYVSAFFPYAQFAVTARDGHVVCSGRPLPAGYSAANLTIFKEIAARHRTVVGPLQRDPLGGPRIVVIGRPLAPNALGATQIGAAIVSTGIQQMIEDVRLPRQSAVVVFDRYGVILARRPDPARFVGMKISAATRRALSPVSGTSDTTGIDGVRRVYASYAAGPWHVAVGIPAGPAYAILTRNLLYELLLIGGLDCVGLALGLIGARRSLARPVAALAATARRLGEGDLAARTGIEGRGGELGELAASLDGMAAALERQADEIEAQVRERTTELQAARRAADSANSAKSPFLSRLSHELRTPLNAIRSFSQLLSLGELAPDQAEAAAHIAAGSEHMTHLVEELLDTARIEAGEFRVDRRPIALGDVVRETVDLTRALAADHDVSIATPEIDPGLAVLADGGRLKQALLNILSNAVVYNRRGGSVSVRVARAPGRRVRIDVLDTGEGIAPEELPRLFTPYDRLGRGPESGGLGLGLALSLRLVEAMGGSIAVASEVGVGSRFTIELEEVALARGVTDRPRSAFPAADATSRRVLYIEDNVTSLKLVELLLRGRGIDFEGASTAADGIAAARAVAPDLILLDLQLPDGSGEQVLRTLRAEPSLRAVPIVMLSAQASRDTVRRLLEAGADDYLIKPIEVDRAADVIERFLRRGRG